MKTRDEKKGLMGKFSQYLVNVANTSPLALRGLAAIIALPAMIGVSYVEQIYKYRPYEKIVGNIILENKVIRIKSERYDDKHFISAIENLGKNRYFLYIDNNNDGILDSLTIVDHKIFCKRKDNKYCVPSITISNSSIPEDMKIRYKEIYSKIGDILTKK